MSSTLKQADIIRVKQHRSKPKEKKRSIRFKRKPLKGLQEGYYDNTNIVYREHQPKGILKTKKTSSSKSKDGKTTRKV